MEAKLGQNEGTLLLAVFHSGEASVCVPILAPAISVTLSTEYPLCLVYLPSTSSWLVLFGFPCAHETEL